MTDKLICEDLDGVLLMTLNRPERLNAVDKELETAFVAKLEEAKRDDNTRAVVVAGAGDRAFCAGYDVHEMSTWPEDQFRTEQMRQTWAWWAIASFPKPLVTANHHQTLGWGAITSVSADIRIGCDLTEWQFTASPHGGANLTWNLPPLIGWSKTKEYLMTSCRVSAQEAKEVGLLNRLVDRDEVLPEALRVAQQMASYPPAGVMTIKRLISEAQGRDQLSQLRAEADAAQAMFVQTGNLVASEYEEFIKK